MEWKDCTFLKSINCNIDVMWLMFQKGFISLFILLAYRWFLLLSVMKTLVQIFWSFKEKMNRIQWKKVEKQNMFHATEKCLISSTRWVNVWRCCSYEILFSVLEKLPDSIISSDIFHSFLLLFFFFFLIHFFLKKSLTCMYLWQVIDVFTLHRCLKSSMSSFSHLEFAKISFSYIEYQFWSMIYCACCYPMKEKWRKSPCLLFVSQ